MAMSALFLNTAFGVYKPKVIYGQDNRHDLYEIQDEAVRKVFQSTTAMLYLRSLTLEGSRYSVKTDVYGEEMQLCSSEKFYHQPAAAMCSGFLVGEDLMATAGHCINENNCDGMAFAFNFAMKSESQAPQSLDKDDVYFCSKVVAHELSRTVDYALVKLDRPVVGHEPLKLATQDAQALDNLIVVGHPSGLPTKVTVEAQVRSSNENYFVANLDTYGGNSGSAVFNAETLEVLGILVRGETDFRYDYAQKCYVSNVCEDDKCRGEDVTHISYIRKGLESTGVTILE